MKHIKLFENFNTPFPEEVDLIDYLQEFFDKYSIKNFDENPLLPDDSISNYTIFHGNEASLSIDIYNDPDKEILNDLLSIQSNIEERLGRKIVIQATDSYDHFHPDMSLYNIIVYMRSVIQ